MTLITEAASVVTLMDTWRRRSERTEAPTPETIRDLRALRDVIRAVPISQQPRVASATIDRGRAQMAQMHLGPPPADLHSAVAAVWEERTTMWASAATLAELHEAFERATEPARVAAADLEQQQIVLRRERERCETLAMLAAVLDEFVAIDAGETT